MLGSCRNLPCPCGSGIKYKKCCLPADEAELLAANARQQRRALTLAERDARQLAAVLDLLSDMLDDPDESR